MGSQPQLGTYSSTVESALSSLVQGSPAVFQCHVKSAVLSSRAPTEIRHPAAGTSRTCVIVSFSRELSGSNELSLDKDASTRGGENRGPNTDTTVSRKVISINQINRVCLLRSQMQSTHTDTHNEHIRLK